MKKKSINECISNIHLGYKRYLEKKVVVFNLTMKQYFLLKKLEKTNLTPANIAEFLFADRPTVTVIINNLKKKDLVDFINNPKDKRSKIVTITKEGLSKLDRVREIEQDKINLTSCLNSNETEILEDLLNKVLLNLNIQTQ